MNKACQIEVLIVGGGPVGLCLAMDLARRGVECLVVERRYAGEPPSVKCNHVSSRTMETFRRLGFADAVRAAGLPDDYPNDVVLRTRATGYELTRIHIPCRRDRFTDTSGPDGWWPTPGTPTPNQSDLSGARPCHERSGHAWQSGSPTELNSSDSSRIPRA